MQLSNQMQMSDTGMSRMKTCLVLFIVMAWGLGLTTSQAAGFPKFKLSNGDEITCIPIHKQTSLASLPEETASSQIFKPSYDLNKETTLNTESEHSDIKHAEQLFKTEAVSCPEGTIPVCAVRGDIPSKGGNFHGDPYQSKPIRASDLHPQSSPADGHEYGTAYRGGIDLQGGYGGAGARFNLWQPYVEARSEFSLSQLWITSGTYAANDLNSIEVGWQVCELIYGDKLPHLFIYWTTDAYGKTGCYNLRCPGFVQVSNTVTIGGAYSTISTLNGQQYEVKLLVYLDAKNSVWWLAVGDVTVGYWPTSLFTRLKTAADNIDWGGEIVNIQTGGRHTRTDMGSGNFASAGYQKAAYIRFMQTVDLKNTLQDAPLAPTDGPGVTKYACYNALKGTSFANWGTYIFFGGPGYSTSCSV